MTLQNGFALNTLDKIGVSSAAPATVAYGLRQLSTTYAGSAIRVRRSSDNTMSDIGFTAAGNLDTATLKTFVGAGDGFIAIWYDQSGNGTNLTQPTAIYQPEIVSAGVVTRQNGVPFITFIGQTGNTNYNCLLLPAAMTTVGHVAAVFKLQSGGDGFILMHTTNYYWHSNPSSTLFNNSLVSASVAGGSGWTNGIVVAPLSMVYPSTLTLIEVAPSTPASGTAWDNIGSDRFLYHNITTGGGYSELIVFPAALSIANRQSMESSQRSYFGLTALPLTWTGFTAQPHGAGILLQWQTANEQNTKAFTVQHSSDGSNWTDIAVLPAAGSGGNNSYSYLHSRPSAGANYYRLLQTDLDGRGSYSTVVTVKLNEAARAFTLLGNPVPNGILQLQLARPLQLSLYSSNGRLLRVQNFDAGIQTISLVGYAKGVYLLKGGGVTQKLVAQ